MLDEQLGVSALVAPDVLNPLKQTNRGCLPNVVLALDMQTLDDLRDCRKVCGLVLLVKPEQVTRKIAEHEVWNFLAVILAMLLQDRLKRRARLDEQRYHLVFRNHGARGMAPRQYGW